MLLDRLLNREKSVYLLGRNILSLQLLNKVNVIAIIDDFCAEVEWEGVPVKRMLDISKESVVISCSYSVSPITAIKKISEYGLQYLTFFDLYNDGRFGLVFTFLDDARDDYNQNRSQYENIKSLLQDEKSKEVFENLINFRNTGLFKYMEGFSVDVLGQYFSKVIQCAESEVFVDAGAYDGQTTSEFIKHCPNYKSVYLFEPSKQNIDQAKINLIVNKNIKFIEKGLSNRAEVLRFHSNNGSASAIADDGDIEIQVDSLDNLVQEKVSFIKMDIEGAESSAIEGARNHILNYHPKMAIAVYHKPDDLWRIPQQVLAIRDDYDLYLRHYTEGTDETIMYFIPKI